MKTLFVTYGGGHVEMCLPVIREMREVQPDCELVILGLTTAYAALARAGESPLGYRDFADAPGAAQALRYGEELLLEQMASGQNQSGIAREESIAYLGFNFLEWVLDEGEAAARARWQAQGRQGFLPRRFMCHVLGRLCPDVVVTTNSPRSEQAAIEAAAALAIPSLSMVDLFALPGDPFLARASYANRLTVLGESTRGNLVLAGIDASRVIVTGNPAFDAFTAPAARTLGEKWRKTRGWNSLHTVLWAGHQESSDLAGMTGGIAGTGLGVAVQQRLVDWTFERSDVALAVRYHPNEWREFPVPPTHPRIHFSRPDEESLLPVLMGCDQVVVQASTVGAQAHAAGKRVLSLGFSPLVRSSGMDYDQLGMGYGVCTLDALVPALEAGQNETALQGRQINHRPAAPMVAIQIFALAQQGAPA